MLSLYRRHLKTCAHKDKGRQWKRCKCPVWVDGTERGIDIRQSLKTTAWEDAEDNLKDLKESPALRINKAKSVADACALFLQDREHGRKLAPDTLRKHRNILDPFQAFCQDKGRVYLKQITFEDMLAFRSSWTDAPLSAGKKLERFKGFLYFCQRAGWIAENPAANLESPIAKDAPTLPFTQEQMKRLIEACGEYPDNYGRRGQTNARRLLAMLLVLRYSGMRIRDAVQLSEDKVQLGKIFLYQQKTGEPVWVPIPAAVNHALETTPGRTSIRYYFWSGNGNPKSAVADWQRSFRKLFCLAGISHTPEDGKPWKRWQKRTNSDGAPVAAHPHMFRDTFAVELLLEGTPIEDVSILLGHRSIKTTQKHYAPWVRARQKKLESAVQKTWAADPILGILQTGDAQGTWEN